MAKWNTGWEIEFPATNADEILLALVVRDLIHGSSFDVEAEETGAEFAVDYTAGDELEDENYRLLLMAEVDGPEDAALLQAFTEQALDELIGEAEAAIAERSEVLDLPLKQLKFAVVPEDEERWDLVIPDWFAPDGAEVPFGFRSFDNTSGKPAPDNAALDAKGRVVAVPFDDKVYFVGIPAPEEHDHEGDES